MKKTSKTASNHPETSIQVLAISHPGIADITAQEAKEIVAAKKIEEGDSYVVFDVASVKDAARFSYKAQSVQRVLLLIADFEIKSEKQDNNCTESLKEDLEALDKDIFKNYSFLSKKTFAARCLKEEGNDEKQELASSLSTLEAESIIGEYIHETLKLKVDLKYPELIFLSYIAGNRLFLGIDVAGFDLSKRDYRLFVHPSSLKGNIAYALVRIADYDKKELFMDPFCGSGTIVIEAALFKASISPHHYKKDKFLLPKIKELKIELEEFDYDTTKIDTKKIDKNNHKEGSNHDSNDNSNDQETDPKSANKKISINKEDIVALDITFNSISSSRKNAKIANIIPYLRFSRCDISWLDTKFDEKSVDKIITNPPRITKTVNAKDVEKVYKELFYQAEFILKEKAIIALITTSPDIIKQKASEYKFKVLHERELWHGKEKLNVVVFEK